MTDRERLYFLHMELPRNGLVVGTSGNISMRIPLAAGGYPWTVLIKPSGVSYDRLQAESMVQVAPDGMVNGSNPYKPSVDTPMHLNLYKCMPRVGGICHTHSPYATAFAVRGGSIPCVMTSMADEFGGEIPCTDKVHYGGNIEPDDVEIALLESYGAILLRSHGVLTVGEAPEQAVAKAIRVEESAKIFILSSGPTGRPPIQLPAADVRKAHRIYKENYGQHRKATDRGI